MAFISRMASGGRITMPAEIRRAMDIKPGNCLSWELKAGCVIVRRHYTFEELCGILPALPGAETAEGLDRLINEAVGEGVERRLRRLDEQ